MGRTSSKDVDCRETAMSDVTSYGRGYDRRDIVPKTKTGKIKMLQLPAMSVWAVY
jgi:hypothetical protein